jgi:hypothetical protein
MTEQHDEWEVEEVQTPKPVGAVISVRLPQDLADRLLREAERRGVRTSAIVREAVEAFLEAGGSSASTLDFTISSRDASVTLYTARSTHGRTSATPLVPSV